MLVYQVGKLEHQVSSLGGREKLPGISFEGLACGLGGQINIFFTGRVDGGDFLLVAATVSFVTLLPRWELTKG